MLLRRNISLCGIKHAGKTTIAKALAELTGTAFADTDDFLRECFQQETGHALSVREIFQELGEDSFRQLEMRSLRAHADFRGILALGGGMLSNPYFTKTDRGFLGILCWIDIPDRTAFQRMESEGLPPFLRNEPFPFDVFREQNAIRRKIFEKEADVVIHPDGRMAKYSAQLIFEACKEAFHE